MRKEQLDNLTKGTRPVLHPSKPDWDTLKGLFERAAVFQNLANTLEWDALRWRRLDDLHKLRNRFDYGDMVEVSEQQLDTAIAGAQDLLDDVLRAFPQIKP